MTTLPHVTLICVDSQNYGDAINAIQKSLEQITPARTIFFTDINIIRKTPFEVVKIAPIKSKKDYSRWMIKELGKQNITTSHILVCQHDGYCLDGNQWRDEFLEWDYIGASWPQEIDGMATGNGGFSLRSTRLCKILAEDPMIKGLHPEDAQICRLYRSYLEDKYDIKFAPVELADLFAFELKQPAQPTFGFHGKFHAPYKEPIVLRRKGALGDIISLEPVMRYFHDKGHLVVLDSQYYLPFARHYFPVMEYSRFDHQRIKHRVINLDLAYEVEPKQLHLKSYFEMCGVTDYELTKPQLSYKIDNSNRLFNQKYVVLHIDARETTHRNIYGVDWQQVVDCLASKGYLVVQIGRSAMQRVGIQFNTVNEALMMWLIAGCEFFIGIDSGPSHIAVALNRMCILTFGSVNPEYIHPDMTDIIALQSPCPADTPHCWHSQPGTRGVDCTIDVEMPPCTVISTEKVIEAINEMI